MALYQLKKVKGKYLILEILGFSYYTEDLSYLLHSSSRSLRALLANNQAIVLSATLALASIPLTLNLRGDNYSITLREDDDDKEDAKTFFIKPQ
jgi:hypothetical protein